MGFFVTQNEPYQYDTARPEDTHYVFFLSVCFATIRDITIGVARAKTAITKGRYSIIIPSFFFIVACAILISITSSLHIYNHTALH